MGRTAAQKRARIGYDFVHAAVDDPSRVPSAEILPDEKGTTCAGFIDRALAYFAALGAPVHAVTGGGACSRGASTGCEVDALTQRSQGGALVDEPVR